MKLRVGKQEFDIKVADTSERRKQGLKGIKKLPKGNGLVLKFDQVQYVPITMQDMKIPLSLVYIRDGIVQQKRNAKPGQLDINISDPVDQVLEVNAGEATGVRVGDTVEWLGSKEDGGTINFIDSDRKSDDGSLHVLDDDGIVQTTLEGNERVFSRVHTNQLVTLASQALSTDNVSDYKKVGRAMVRMINKQDIQEPEYVEERG